jgi:hypothetical protein
MSRQQEFDAIAEILTPAAPNERGVDVLALYSERPQDLPIVHLPAMTPRMFLQMLLILQEAQNEEWATVDLQELVVDIHRHIRENWTYT